MSVQYSPFLKIEYDSAKPLDAQRAMQAEVQNLLRMKQQQELSLLTGQVVLRARVVDLLKEITLAIEQIVVDYPEAYDRLETRLNDTLKRHGYAP